MFTVLVVEDEMKIRSIIASELQKWGYAVHVVEDFRQVEESFLTVKPNLVLLDINLPYMNGFYWCERIRRHSNVPIVFLSSRTETMDMMMALNMGGDDFVQKPFSMEMLLTKIHALLRRTYTYQQADTDRLTHRDLTLNVKKAALSTPEGEIELTKNEFRILCVLLERKSEIVPRDELITALWEDENFIDDNTLTVNINRLRRKLGEYGMVGYIQTKKGQGYILS
ncbi:response regulator transcription factor [Sporosarcina thermotolerans]|uniref:Response regulator transcription factor n=2 Tax=Sporosarcina thermotolerans TaxID=633404 RepID=A0AAW9ADQ0_9BACL|nr:response regulator transcription factor [Sporosarcina thermotolerans]MDW0117748.1 response regulator transcription factor [Sporosarcina thermotolerans]